LAVEVRYPGLFMDARDASEALLTAEKVRSLIQTSLDLKK
jgi:hypothetical protein